jgi:hypothetical protein
MDAEKSIPLFPDCPGPVRFEASRGEPTAGPAARMAYRFLAERR